MNFIRSFIEGAVAALGIVTVLLITFSGLILVLLYLSARVKLFKKCGQAGWKALIPFYTTYVEFTQMAGLHWLWFALYMAISFFSIKERYAELLKAFMFAICFYNLALKFRKDPIPYMIFGAFFSPLITIILGFTKSNYDSHVAVKSSGLF